jgi:hypothetical protein
MVHSTGVHCAVWCAWHSTIPVLTHRRYDDLPAQRRNTAWTTKDTARRSGWLGNTHLGWHSRGGCLLAAWRPGAPGTGGPADHPGREEGVSCVISVFDFHGGDSRIGATPTSCRMNVPPHPVRGVNRRRWRSLNGSILTRSLPIVNRAGCFLSAQGSSGRRTAGPPRLRTWV